MLLDSSLSFLSGVQSIKCSEWSPLLAAPIHEEMSSHSADDSKRHSQRDPYRNVAHCGARARTDRQPKGKPSSDDRLAWWCLLLAHAAHATGGVSRHDSP